jgi:predicted phosphodiesterase
MTKKVMIVPDLQVPYHSVSFVKKLIQVAKDWQPDTICFIGDVLDFPEVSRWTKSGRGEFEPTLQASLDKGITILGQFRLAAPKADIRYKMGNHDERLEKYINDYAPALRSLRTSDIGYQLGLDQLEIKIERDPFLLAPDVLAVHGHERAYSSVLGRYEGERIKQYGLSVVSGHTHTPVLITTATGFGLKQKHRFGMNVGHGMDPKKCGYTKDGYLNWCQGFGVIEVVNGVSYPTLVTAPAGHFMFMGEKY